jgi:hypothetical protein
MPSTTRPFNSYRWVYAWLGLSAVLAVILLGNAIRDYLFVTHLIQTQQVRRQMRQSVNSLEQQLRKSWKPGNSRLQLLTEDFDRAGEKPLWLEIRASDGEVLEHSGSKPATSFTLEQESTSFRTHESLYRLVKMPHGEAVVEIFPMFTPSPRPPRETDAPNGAPQPHAEHPPGPRQPLVVEVALPLTPGDPTLLAAQRWNLFIACSVALALLATVGIAAWSIRRYVRGRLLEQQVEIAREVQARLLPSKSAVFPGLRVATEYLPSEEVGGDLYDIFPTPDGKIALLIGDVSGKGIPAALLVGVIHGAVRSGDWTDSPELHERACAALNRLLCESASGERYATIFWSYFDPTTRTLHSINAGHCPQLLLTTRNGSPECLRLDTGGPVVGILPDAPYRQSAIRVETGDRLILFSDGLVEATRADGTEFGESRVRDLLTTLTDTSPEAIRNQLLEAVHTFLGSTTLDDDLTLVIAAFEPS